MVEESSHTFRILFLADTHLGLEMPEHPRVEKKRRGQDFFDNFERALSCAFRQEVDCVVHGGDILYRSRVSASLVYRAFEPLVRVAEAGVPVYVVPGNHERSKVPFSLVAYHPHVHIFDVPRTFILQKGPLRLALSGFPCERTRIREKFRNILCETKWFDNDADMRLLCMHQLVEGAQVGVHNMTFRSGDDVIAGQDIPGDFAVILSGHIHRSQILRYDLVGHQLGSPVLYAGAIERTSFDEREEGKGYLKVVIGRGNRPVGRLEEWSFHELPTRPMKVIKLTADDLNPQNIDAVLHDHVRNVAPNSIIRFRIRGELSAETAALLRIERLRQKLGPDLEISIRLKP